MMGNMIVSYIHVHMEYNCYSTLISSHRMIKFEFTTIVETLILVLIPLLWELLLMVNPKVGVYSVPDIYTCWKFMSCYSGLIEVHIHHYLPVTSYDHHLDPHRYRVGVQFDYHES